MTVSKKFFCLRALLIFSIIVIIFFMWSAGDVKVLLGLHHLNPKRLEYVTTPVHTPGTSDILCSSASHQNDSTIKPGLILWRDFPQYYELKDHSGTFCGHKCEITVNSSRLAEAHAVIFYAHSHISLASRNRTLPRKRAGQVWVYFAVESPQYSNNEAFASPVWHRLFNWTMTYRHDSEFWHGYVDVQKRVAPVPEEERTKLEQGWRQIFSQKTKMVAWFVSHCETYSKREQYVAKLRQFIPVDTYGNCGALKCNDRKACMAMVARDYKFYLSFENSLCKGYMTEKTGNILMLKSVIPVVRGGEKYRELLPPNSVIDTRDFSSPKELAEHLKALAKDEDAYVKMLQWSWEYEVKEHTRLPLCELCKRLHQPALVSCYYDNVYGWWAKNACLEPNDI